MPDPREWLTSEEAAELQAKRLLTREPVREGYASAGAERAAAVERLRNLAREDLAALAAALPSGCGATLPEPPAAEYVGPVDRRIDTPAATSEVRDSSPPSGDGERGRELLGTVLREVGAVQLGTTLAKEIRDYLAAAPSSREGEPSDAQIEAGCRVLDADWRTDYTEHTPAGEHTWDTVEAVLRAAAAESGNGRELR